MSDEDTVAAAFRNAMRRFAATVTVISLGDGEERYGMTATAVTSVSMSPPSLLACINNASAFYPVIAHAERFCVNILQRDQAAISNAFSSRLMPEERFAHGLWWSDRHFVPFLDDAQANVFCRRVQLMPFGSHCIVIGEVYDARFRSEVMPLAYCDGSYAEPTPLTGGACRTAVTNP